MSQYISKQAIVNWIEEQIKDKNWPHEMRYAFKKVGNEIGSDRFDCHGIENVSPETREKIGKVVAEIRADKAEAELTKEREAKAKLRKYHLDRIEHWKQFRKEFKDGSYSLQEACEIRIDTNQVALKMLDSILEGNEPNEGTHNSRSLD